MKNSDTGDDEREQPGVQIGVQALETGLRILDALATNPGPMRLSDVAALADMHPAKAHRYLVSFIRYGYVMQDAAGLYHVGPVAVRNGLSSLAQMDYARLATPAVSAIAAELDETVFAAIWSQAGPMILYVREPWRPVAVNVRLGSIVPMLTSATGRVFSAFAPSTYTKPLIQAEIAAGVLGSAAKTDSDPVVEKLRVKVRKAGLGYSHGDYITGINAVCAPVFDHHGQLVISIATAGMESRFTQQKLEQAGVLIKSHCDDISKQLGYRPDSQWIRPDDATWG